MVYSKYIAFLYDILVPVIHLFRRKLRYDTVLAALEGPDEYGQPSSARLRGVEQVHNGCHRMLDCALRSFDFADRKSLPFERRLTTPPETIQVSMSKLRRRDDIRVFETVSELFASASARRRLARWCSG